MNLPDWMQRFLPWTIKTYTSEKIYAAWRLL
jgi:hypothetical protein